MPFAQVRDINMYYETRGSGPRLLFLGSTGSDLRRGAPIYQSPLAEKFEILACDQRGQGQTDSPDAPCTMADYAEDANGLLEAVGWDQCSVVGVSFGGMVAQELAIRHPDRVERMTLVVTSSGGAGGNSFPLEQLSELPPEERARKRMEVMDTRRGAEWQAANAEQLQRSIDQEQANDERDRDPSQAATQTGSRRQLEARAKHDTYDRLPELTMPVLVCGGLYDGNARSDNIIALAQRIPNAQLEFFQGGHVLWMGDQRAWERIQAFLTP